MATISSTLEFQDKMSGVIKKVTTALDKATIATEKAKQEMEDMTYAYGAGSKEANTATMAYAKAKNQMDSLSRTLENAKNQQNEFARAEREAALNAAFQAKNTSLLSKAGGFLKDVFSGVAGKFAIGAKMVDIAVNAIINAFNRLKQATQEALQSYSKFQSSLIDVTNLLSEQEKLQYGDSLKKASQEAIKAGISIEQANTALFNSVSALGDVNKALAVYKQAQILAKGGATSLETATSGLTNVLNAYRLSAEEANNVSVAFFRAQKVGVTTVGELANAIGGVAPIAKSAGVSYQELLATMAVLTKGGLDTASAATALRASMTALIKPSKQAEEVLRAYGVPVGAAELQTKGLAYALTRLQEAAEANPDVMAEMIPNIRALTGVSTLTADSIALVDQTIKDMNNDIANGTGLMEAYNAKMNTLEASENKLRGAKENLARAWGQMLSPIAIAWNKILTWIINTTAKVIDGINTLGNGISNLWGKITGKQNNQNKSLNVNTNNTVNPIATTSKIEEKINVASNRRNLINTRSGIDRYSDGKSLRVKQQGAISLQKEDVELLHDIATRDYAQYFQQLTPNLTIPNMVIHETADVNQVIGAIANAVTGSISSSTTGGYATV